METIKKNLPRYFLLAFANLISAINFNLLVKPINLVNGGSPGLAIVISKIADIDTNTIINIIYVITFILGIIFLEKKTIIGIVFASITYPLFVNLTSNITNIVSLRYYDIFLIVLVASVISGISNGIVYKNGFASSGLGIIAPILNKYFKISISVSNFVINTIILLMGGYFFGFNIILYAVFYLYVSNYICNVIILGVSQNKVIFIRTKKIDKVLKLLHDKYHINTIIVGEDEPELVVVSNTIRYSYIRKDLISIDKSIFFTTENCYEVAE